MKKFVSIICAFALCFGSFGAFADTPSLTQSMTQITQTVKTILNIGDDFESFNGSYNEGRWELSWSKEDAWTDVTCADDGTIYRYYSYESSDEKEVYGAINASFPKYSPEDFQKAAEEFLNRVVSNAGWGWKLNDFEPALRRNSYSTARASGVITLNGYPTDIGFSIGLNPDTAEVTNFYRSDCYSLYKQGGESAETGEIDIEEIKRKLIENYAMELVYLITDEKDMARLVYKRVDDHKIAFDIKTGEVILIGDNALYTEESMDDAGFGAAEAESKSLRSLTETELKGIAVYEDALGIDELDKLVRAIPELIIGENDELIDSNYFVSNDKPYARLGYYRELKNDEFIEISVCVDAKTGKITSLYSYGSGSAYNKQYAKINDEVFRPIAEQFIEKYYGEVNGQTKMTRSGVVEPLTGSNPCVIYTFTREYQGYLFKQNTVTVRINTDDHSVCGFDMNWDEGQEFYDPEPESLISEEEARLDWIGESPLIVKYLSVSDSDGRGRPTHTLTLCYCFDEKNDVYAIDAHSKERYGYETGAKNTFDYPETDGMLYEDEVRTLGAYGIGLSDCLFTKDDMLTPERLMRLILQSMAYEYGMSMDSEELTRVFRNSFGTVPAAKDGVVTRGEALRILVLAAGLGEAAKLEGIYSVDANDWSEVPEQLKGSLAIAWALKLIELENGSFKADESATAAMAAHAIYALLSR